jgi:hypothetical protein
LPRSPSALKRRRDSSAPWSGQFVGKAVEKTLSPPKYHFRLPWFAKIHWHKPDLLFYQTFTAKECAQALKEALDFVAANPQVCPANTVIIYAWNDLMKVDGFARRSALTANPIQAALKP